MSVQSGVVTLLCTHLTIKTFICPLRRILCRAGR